MILEAHAKNTKFTPKVSATEAAVAEVQEYLAAKDRNFKPAHPVQSAKPK